MNLQRNTRALGPISLIPITVQVAAVCYRQGRAGTEFLLVRTSSGRWIFPKGNIDDSLPRYDAASREASEEAGAMGRIEARCFHIFKYWKSPEDDLVFVEAYLMEVQRTESPEEEHREPTWFKPEGAREAIAEGRDPQSAAELASVIDSAVKTIQGAGKPERPSVRRR